MKISVIIPALNEEQNLRRAITHLRKTAEEAFELIVADGGSADGTLRTAEKMADIAVRCLIKGRATQMHEGALKAQGELLLFLHADTLVPDHWQECLNRAWSKKPKPALTAFRLKFDPDTYWFRFVAFSAHLRNQITGVPHGDQALAVLRSRYLEAGGFPPVPLMEEYYLIPRLKKFGPVITLEKSAVTSARRYLARGPLRNSLRNNTIVLMHYLGARPESLAKIYQTTGITL